MLLLCDVLITSADTTPPIINQLTNVQLQCGDAFSTNTTGIPTVTDTQDPNPTLSYRDNPSSGCILERIWTATDEAGNEASQTQNITFTSTQPPELQLPLSVLLACGDPVNDDRSAEDLVNEGLLSHQCNRSMDVKYTDSTAQKYCGMTFTRTWTVTDDCGGQTQRDQTVIILEPSMPEQPINNQMNVDLDITIQWPPYPNTVLHNLYVWPESSTKPNGPTYVTSTRQYKTPNPYLPNTKYLWQVEYQLDHESGDLLNATIVPSPTWSFITRTYADFAVAQIDIPSSGAFSGKDVTISWTVVNVGSRGSVTSYWYDEVYLAIDSEFTNPIRIARIQERQFLDPGDGYVASVTVQLGQDRIGQYYVFVKTDVYGYVDDYDRDNNIGRSDGPLDVRLTPPPDLVVSSIITPDNSFSGMCSIVRLLLKSLIMCAYPE